MEENAGGQFAANRFIQRTSQFTAPMNAPLMTHKKTKPLNVVKTAKRGVLFANF